MSNEKEMRRNAHVRVVGGLGHVNVVIRMDWLLGAKLTAQYFDCAVGNYLGVHQYQTSGTSGSYLWHPRSHFATNLVGIHIRLSP